jgi:hypothetical protein
MAQLYPFAVKERITRWGADPGEATSETGLWRLCVVVLQLLIWMKKRRDELGQ